MKKLILLVLVIIVSGCGTDQGPAKVYNYTIVNKSGVTVDIIPFTQQGDKDLARKTTLIDERSINKQEKSYPPYNGGTSLPDLIYPNSYLTKVEFVFNNTKKAIYTRYISTNGEPLICVEPKNIFSGDYVSVLTVVYTITPEDYQNAIDCGGTCN